MRVKKFDALLTGVGGEGVLTTSVILARAAGIEGYKVIGTQFHGLAQRGGSIPTHVRFGSDVYSPMVQRGSADIILALEPAEALRVAWFASKNKTTFVIDDYPIKPVYVNILKEKYPSTDEIKKMLRPISKEIFSINASEICKKELGDIIYGNVMILGFAFSKGLIPLKKESLLKSLEQTVPRNLDKNIEAFELGIDYGD